MGLLDTSIEGNLTNATQSGLLGLGVDEEMAKKIAPWLAIAPQFIPFVGAGVGVDNTVRALDKGNYGEAAFEGAMTLLGEVPVVGDVAGKAIRGGADRLGIFGSRGAAGADEAGADAAERVFAEQKSNPSLDMSNRHQVNDLVRRQMRESAEAGSSSQPWFIGADQKPRFEIPDNRATIDGNLKKHHIRAMQTKLNEMKGGHYEYPLGQIMKHEALYKQYPQVADIPVSIVRGEDAGGIASYMPRVEGDDWLQDGRIQLNVDSLLKDGRSSMMDTLLHETQHAIQDIEGLAVGTGTDNFLRDAKRFLNQNSGTADPINRAHLDDLEGVLKEMEADPQLADRMADKLAETNYLMSAGEAEARAVEIRRHLKAKERGLLAPSNDYTMPMEGLEADPSMFDFLPIFRN